MVTLDDLNDFPKKLTGFIESLSMVWRVFEEGCKDFQNINPDSLKNVRNMLLSTLNRVWEKLRVDLNK